RVSSIPGLNAANRYGPAPTGAFLNPSGPTCSADFFGTIHAARAPASRVAGPVNPSAAASQHGAGHGTPVSAMLIEHAAVHDGGVHAAGLRDQPLAAAGEIVHVLRRHVVHGVGIEEHEIGGLAGRDDA